MEGVHKKQNPNQQLFVHAVEPHFGLYDYRTALAKLLELWQDSSVEEYANTFQTLQYEILMHNSGFDELYFVSQFIKGLKPDLRALVQTQESDTMHRAIMLAKL